MSVELILKLELAILLNPDLSSQKEKKNLINYIMKRNLMFFIYLKNNSLVLNW